MGVGSYQYKAKQVTINNFFNTIRGPVKSEGVQQSSFNSPLMVQGFQLAVSDGSVEKATSGLSNSTLEGWNCKSSDPGSLGNSGFKPRGEGNDWGEEITPVALDFSPAKGMGLTPEKKMTLVCDESPVRPKGSVEPNTSTKRKATDCDIFEDEEEMLERKAKVQDWMNKNFDFMCKGNNTPSGSQSTPSITDYLLKKSSEDSILSRDGTSEAVPASQPRNFTPEKQK